MKQKELIKYCNDLLKSTFIQDYCPNGLQIEGDNREVHKIVIGVSISLEFIEKAIEKECDLILTHHGMIWNNDSRVIEGPFKKKISLLLEEGIASASYHLPLDYHPTLGNNYQLAKILGLKNIQALPAESDFAEAVIGETPCSTIDDFESIIIKKLNRKPQILPFGKPNISKAVIITGGAQNYYMTAVNEEADCFITGEISEKNYAVSQEYGIHYIGAGHYATEKWGIKALAEHLKGEFNIDYSFIEIDNPV